jgi:hypothetical protein
MLITNTTKNEFYNELRIIEAMGRNFVNYLKGTMVNIFKKSTTINPQIL